MAVVCGEQFIISLDDNGNIWKWDDIPTIVEGLVNVVEISSSSNHIAFVDVEGQVYTHCTPGGELGIGIHPSSGNIRNSLVFALEEDEYNGNIIPRVVPELKNIISVTCGVGNTFCIDSQRKVFAFGANSKGQLGVGDTTDRFTPVLITDIENVKQISSGSEHTLFLNIYGVVLGAGLNTSGQLGTVEVVYYYVPKIIDNLPEIEAVACGKQHSLFLTCEGEIFGCGNNSAYQMELGNTINSFKPMRVEWNGLVRMIYCEGNTSCFVDDQRNVWVFGGRKSLDPFFSMSVDGTAVKCDFLKDVESISQGRHAIIKTKTEVWMTFVDEPPMKLGDEFFNVIRSIQRYNNVKSARK